MARRIYRAKNCIKYRESTLSPYPVLRVKLYNVMFESYGELELQIDTGFEGSILLRAEDYEFFQVGELPRDYWRTYRTLSGNIIMRVARALMEVNGRRYEVYVESPLYGGGKNLIGREVINNLVLVLDGPKNECCLV